MPAERSSPPPSRPLQPARSLRLIFEVEDGQVRLVSRQRVAMIPPAQTVPPPGAEQAGFWVNLHAGDDRVLFSQAMESPLRADVEVFDPDPGRSLHRQPVERRRGTFVLLVPDLPEARAVALAGSPLASGVPGAGAPSDRLAASEPPREIARFPLPPSDETEGPR